VVVWTSGPAGERATRPVVGEVGEDPQLDLRVVGREQAAPGIGDEGAAHLASVGRAHGTFCRFGASLEIRPVVVASWLKVAWTRPSGPISGGSASA